MARLLNKHICAVILAGDHCEYQDLLETAMISYGSQVNGSWRNAIGKKAVNLVWEMVLRHLGDGGVIQAVQLKNGRVVSPSPTGDPANVKQIRLKGGQTLTMGSEPDISGRNEKGTLVVAIEVKGGLDPAGALERYGAVKKSFDAALKENPRSETILIMGAITKEVKSRIEDDRLVREYYALDQAVVATPSNLLVKRIRWAMHLG